MKQFKTTKVERRVKAATWILLWLGLAAADAATLLVGPGNPYLTIQAALNAAAPLDTISVSAGTYFENLSITKPVTIVGAGATQTVIDGSKSNSVATVLHSVTVKFINLTIRNGRAVNGGGVSSGGHLYMSGCNVLSNQALQTSGNAAGGGLYVHSCELIDSVIANNRSTGTSQGDDDGDPVVIGESYGGGIYLNGTGSLTRCTVRANLCEALRSTMLDLGGSSRGGGIYSVDDVSLTSCLVSSNTAKGCDAASINGGTGGDAKGGGIYCSTDLSGLMTTVTLNRAVAGSGDNIGGIALGGAVYLHGKLTATSCDVEANSASGGSGVSRSMGNGGSGGMAQGGGAWSDGGLELNDCSVALNAVAGGSPETSFGRGGNAEGGGLWVSTRLALNSIVVAAIRSTFSGNEAVAGGGLRHAGDARGGALSIEAVENSSMAFQVLNCTIAANTASSARQTLTDSGTSSGGGVWLNIATNAGITGAGAVGHNTVVFNRVLDLASVLSTNVRATGGGIALAGRPSAELRRSIVFGNLADGEGPDVFSDLLAASDCLIGSTAGSNNVAAVGVNVTVGANPLLSALAAKFGGRTLVYALLAGSPAIDAAVCDPAVTTDQRGFPRPSGAGCDIGPYEVQPIDLSTRAVEGDFDGDKRTDVAVFRPQSGTWYISQSQSDTLFQQNWGFDEVVPVPGDYDGDAKADIAVYHPATGNWSIRQSSNGQLVQRQWGWSETLPVPMDYDGDEISDIAVYHPATGNWYIRQSTNGQLFQQQWGTSATKPVPGDYDGDGRWDIAVYEPATGNWYIRYSDDGTLFQQNWGWSETLPVHADYDGDLTTDIAVFHPVTGNWYIRQSTTAQLVQYQWGWSETTPVPADYDRDGRADPTVYHQQTGNWYIRQSVTGTLLLRNWGWSETHPVLRRTEPQ